MSTHLTGEFSLFNRLQAAASRAPDAPAVTDSASGSLTRRQLLVEAARLAEWYAELRVRRGDVVAIALPNTVEWEVAFVACLSIGAIPATLPFSTEEDGVVHACRLTGARLLVTAGDSGPQVVQRLEGRVGLLASSEGDWQVDRGPVKEGMPRPDTLEGIAQVMFTSSSTGLPKAVGHSESSLAAVNLGFAERFSLDASTPIFMASPLGHSIGAWHGTRLSLFLGAHLVLQERWGPAEAMALMARHGCVFTAAATPYLQDLVTAAEQHEAQSLPLRTFLCGGAPVPPSLLERAESALPGTFVTVLWGMTEGGVTTCLPGDPPDRVLGSAGVGLPGLELVTLSSDGTVLDTDVEGEVAMRGPGVFKTYVGQPELYAESLAGDWFRTGDLGTVDDAGYLHLRGRIKDLIIRGGVNISPIPIEEALIAHPSVREAAVIGYPDDRLGERIGAVVVADGTAPTFDELVSWLAAGGLPKRWLLEKLWVVAAMPTTAAGKIRKSELRAYVRDEAPRSVR